MSGRSRHGAVPRNFLTVTITAAWMIAAVGRATAAAWPTPTAHTPTSTATPRPTATVTVTSTPTATPYTVCAPDHTSCLVRYATATPAASATGTAGATSGSGQGGGGGCDFWNIGTWGPCIAAATVSSVADTVDNVNATIGASDLWTNTDPALTFGNPVVATYWGGVRTLADAFIIFIFLGICVEILLCIGAHRTYAGALERFWRLALVALLANGSLPVLGTAITLANAVTDGAVAIQSTRLFAVGGHSGVANQVLLEALLGLVDGLMELLLAIQMIIRIGLLDALIVLAPAGLLCYAWPRVQGMAELWGRLFVVTLVTQFVQIVVLHMGEDLVLYAPLVFGKDGATIVGETSLGNMITWAQYLVALGVFVVVLRVPRILRGYTGTPLAVSLLAVRTLTGGLGGRGGGGG